MNPYPHFPMRTPRKTYSKGIDSHRVTPLLSVVQDLNPELIPQFALKSPLPLNTSDTASMPAISLGGV